MARTRTISESQPATGLPGEFLRWVLRIPVGGIVSSLPDVEKADTPIIRDRRLWNQGGDLPVMRLWL